MVLSITPPTLLDFSAGLKKQPQVLPEFFQLLRVFQIPE
jgi:hypothetical protein